MVYSGSPVWKGKIPVAERSLLSRAMCVITVSGQFAPWTIRPGQFAPDLQTTRPQYENPCVTLGKYIFMLIK